MVQSRALHPSVLTWASAQTLPHDPQLAGSMAMLAQYCDGAVPQVERGDAQVVEHVPREQKVPAAQAIPHAPQLLLSVWVLTSQPSAAVWLQSA